ncbi:hypothetical protein NE237_009766 [Protea cynaroides]|uniref:Uncharacterized protein n=1 Tax=Protea cynaroides TaxID=273540 RepID=A0A9Q0KYF2_9MAGN|nr:hypothetical protein NE237_009766 [Protea cynaroides]
MVELRRQLQLAEEREQGLEASIPQKGAHSLHDYVRKEIGQDVDLSRYQLDVDDPTDTEEEEGTPEEHLLEEPHLRRSLRPSQLRMLAALPPGQSEAKREIFANLLSEVKALCVQLLETTAHCDKLVVGIEELETPWLT